MSLPPDNIYIYLHIVEATKQCERQRILAQVAPEQCCEASSQQHHLTQAAEHCSHGAHLARGGHGGHGGYGGYGGHGYGS